MTYKALIVEDDLQIVDTIVDALASLGHEHDTAHSQSDAMKWLTANDYTYVLLDIRIPARTRTGEPRIQNTENLLEKIAEIKDGNAPPVIILSDYIASSLDTTEDVMRLAMSLSAKGSADIIKKPFPTVGRTLDRVIKKVLGLNGKPRRKRRRKSARAKKSRRASKTSKRTTPENKAEAPQKKPAADEFRWPGIPNEPITLDEFMVKFCEPRSKASRRCRRKALLAAARNGKQGKSSVTLPPLAVPHKNGRPHKYITHDLLSAWPRYIAEGIDLPTLSVGKKE